MSLYESQSIHITMAIKKGCGLGIPGLCAAQLGASSVLLTDIPECKKYRNHDLFSTYM